MKHRLGWRQIRSRSWITRRVRSGAMCRARPKLMGTPPVSHSGWIIPQQVMLDSNSGGNLGPLWIQAPSVSRSAMVRYRSWRDGVVTVPRERWQTSTSASSQVTSTFPASNNASFASVSALLINAPSNVLARPWRKKSPSSLNPTARRCSGSGSAVELVRSLVSVVLAGNAWTSPPVTGRLLLIGPDRRLHDHYAPGPVSRPPQPDQPTTTLPRTLRTSPVAQLDVQRSSRSAWPVPVRDLVCHANHAEGVFNP